MDPYSDSIDHLLAELERLDLMLRVHLEAWWAENDRGVDEYRGLYVDDETVDSLLSVHDNGRTASRATPGDDLGAAIADRAEEIHERKRATLAAGTSLRLVDLAERFDLTPRHVDTLLLALAPELDSAYETIYSYLQDDVTKTLPTVGLVLDVLCNSEHDRIETRTLFGWHSPLRRHGLIDVAGGDDAPLLSRPLSADGRVVEYLLELDAVDGDLADIATATSPTGRREDLPVDDARARSLDHLASRLSATGEPPVLASLGGRDDERLSATVAALCAERGLRLLRADATAIRDRPVVETTRLLVREARLQDAAIHVTSVDALAETTPPQLDAALEVLDEFDGHVFLTGTDTLSAGHRRRVTAHDVRTIRFPMPSYEVRRALWSDVSGLPDDVDVATLAATFQLTSGQIEAAVAMAEARSPVGEITTEELYRACRAQSTEQLGSLAQHRTPHYTWDDIVLPADTRSHLREIAAQITHRGTVYADWGFEDAFSLGNGLTALFTGAPGTGKTMAADVIAQNAGLDLYKIDLASVVDKYVGETEKNIERIFEEAEYSDAILLFDEADALFGKRSEVSDAQDRYANVQVNYLLQRIEEHDGTAILTTNFKDNIDDAFLRRIDHSVEFPRPDRDLRTEIWETVFPEATPVGDLDYEFLSTFEVTGGTIKNTAVNAAFMAVDDGDAVEMEHVVRAMRREFQKTGKLIAPDDFGEYADHVAT